MNIVQRWFNYLKTRKQHRKVIKELNQLTNRELADIGINRGDISRLIWLDIDKKKQGKQG